MGSKIVDIGSLVYAETSGILPEDGIIYADLVKTLQLEPTKYMKPKIDKHGNVVFNSIFLKAAMDAGLTHIIVDTPEEDSSIPDWPTDKEVILKNLVFFNNPSFNQPSLDKIFEKYLCDCKISFYYPLITMGIIERESHEIIEPDILKYSLYGSLESQENKSRLLRPTKALYGELKQTVGQIRSLNGQVLQYSY